MQYLLLIYEDEKDLIGMSESESKAFMGEWYAFDEAARKATNVLGGNPLQPVATATTVRQKDGKTITSDGPFAETKEQLGGYYLIDAENLDQAMEVASKMPNVAKGGSVEVRPIMEMSM